MGASSQDVIWLLPDNWSSFYLYENKSKMLLNIGAPSPAVCCWPWVWPRGPSFTTSSMMRDELSQEFFLCYYHVNVDPSNCFLYASCQGTCLSMCLCNLVQTWDLSFRGALEQGWNMKSTITIKFLWGLEPLSAPGGEALASLSEILSPDSVHLISIKISSEQRWKQSDLLSNFSPASAFCFPCPWGALSGWQQWVSDGRFS